MCANRETHHPSVVSITLHGDPLLMQETAAWRSRFVVFHAAASSYCCTTTSKQLKVSVATRYLTAHMQTKHHLTCPSLWNLISLRKKSHLTYQCHLSNSPAVFISEYLSFSRPLVYMMHFLPVWSVIQDPDKCWCFFYQPVEPACPPVVTHHGSLRFPHLFTFLFIQQGHFECGSVKVYVSHAQISTWW